MEEQANGASAEDVAVDQDEESLAGSETEPNAEPVLGDGTRVAIGASG